MSLKKDLAKEMNLIEAEIKELEVKRERSQSSIIRMLVAKQDPSTTDDWTYFCQYCADIEVKRDKLKELNDQLKKLV